MNFRKRITSIIIYTFYILIIIIVSDLILFKRIMNLGYPSHYRQENWERSPAPFIEFKGAPNVLDHNKYGFRGKIVNMADSNSIKIAFFGGSTGYMGKPPIASILEKELSGLLDSNVDVMNFSAVSSNHRQHIHYMIEYLFKFQPDIVVFYGGYNETIQSGLYDPRPGYPYNFFYRAELSTFRKLLLENSAIIGTLDLNFGLISGIAKLKERYQPFSLKWNNSIVDKYFETIMIGKELSKCVKTKRFKKNYFYAFYQPCQIPKNFIAAHLKIRERTNNLKYFYDVSNTFDSLGADIFDDIVHVKQPGNELMGKTIANTIYHKLIN